MRSLGRLGTGCCKIRIPGRIRVANFFTELVTDQLSFTRSGVSKCLLSYSNLAARLRRDEKGATAVEYGIMVALIAVVIIVAVTLLGGNADTMFEQFSARLSGGSSGRPPRDLRHGPPAEPAPVASSSPR